MSPNRSLQRIPDEVCLSFICKRSPIRATAGSARTCSRDLSLENPICCRADTVPYSERRGAPFAQVSFCRLRMQRISSPTQTNSSPQRQRALPAPAQGTCPLRIPLAAAQVPFPCNKCRAAPAPEPPGVASHILSSQNATKAPCPILAGAGGRRPFAAALVVDTIDRGSSGCRYHRPIDRTRILLHIGQ